MLQSRVRSRMASRLSFQVLVSQIRSMMSPSSLGPMKVYMNKAKAELKMLPDQKHWFCSSTRSIAMAAYLLQEGKIIAIPTDTVYGLACRASDTDAVQRLYEIKKRDEAKPLAICLSNVKEISTWGVTDDIPSNLLTTLLPGPYTICLRRTPALNPALNPGIDTVGIRVPNDKFVRCVAKLVGPLALTSANVSSEPSSLQPEEFSVLWPQLDGIFHAQTNPKKQVDHRRVGSTVIDLSEPRYYRIVRRGIGYNAIPGTLRYFGLKDIAAQQQPSAQLSAG